MTTANSVGQKWLPRTRAYLIIGDELDPHQFMKLSNVNISSIKHHQFKCNEVSDSQSFPSTQRSTCRLIMVTMVTIIIASFQGA